MRQFDHLLITRFNVRVHSDQSASNDWLRHRLHYFTSVCCPSVEYQTSRNFKWIVLFDAERDSWFNDKVQGLSQTGLFKPAWVTGVFSQTMIASIAAEYSSAEWLITSRLDNDDAIARDYIAQVQSHFKGQLMEFINFQTGLQLTASGRLLHRLDPSSPFISLIESRSQNAPKTVYGWPHNEVGRHASLRQIKSHPMWLQVIHEKNLGNQARGIRAEPRLLAEYFDVDATATPISRTALLVDKVKSSILLSWRVLQKPSRIFWLSRVIWNKLRPSHSQRSSRHPKISSE